MVSPLSAGLITVWCSVFRLRIAASCGGLRLEIVRGRGETEHEVGFERMPDVGDVLEENGLVGVRWLPVACLFEGVSCLVIVSELSKKRGAWCVERGVMRREDEFETFVEKEYMVMEDGTVGEVGEVD